MTGDLFIVSFRGAYSCFSSFWYAPFTMPEFPGTILPTREHYFQARKAVSSADLNWILTAPSPQEAKRRGNAIQCRENWDDLRRLVMMQAVLTQFSAHDPMRSVLGGTGRAVLVEGNSWGDTYWGAVVSGSELTGNAPVWSCGGLVLAGHNWLGRILMMARDVLA